MTATLTETAPGFHIDPDYQTLLKQMGLDNVDALTAAMRTFCIPGKIELAGKAIVADNLIEEVSITKHVTALIELYDKIMAQKENR